MLLTAPVPALSGSPAAALAKLSSDPAETHDELPPELPPKKQHQQQKHQQEQPRSRLVVQLLTAAAVFVIAVAGLRAHFGSVAAAARASAGAGSDASSVAFQRAACDFPSTFIAAPMTFTVDCVAAPAVAAISSLFVSSADGGVSGRRASPRAPGYLPPVRLRTRAAAPAAAVPPADAAAFIPLHVGTTLLDSVDADAAARQRAAAALADLYAAYINNDAASTTAAALPPAAADAIGQPSVTPPSVAALERLWASGTAASDSTAAVWAVQALLRGLRAAAAAPPPAPVGAVGLRVLRLKRPATAAEAAAAAAALAPFGGGVVTELPAEASLLLTVPLAAAARAEATAALTACALPVLSQAATTGAPPGTADAASARTAATAAAAALAAALAPVSLVSTLSPELAAALVLALPASAAAAPTVTAPAAGTEAREQWELTVTAAEAVLAAAPALLPARVVHAAAVYARAVDAAAEADGAGAVDAAEIGDGAGAVGDVGAVAATPWGLRLGGTALLRALDAAHSKEAGVLSHGALAPATLRPHGLVLWVSLLAQRLPQLETDRAGARAHVDAALAAAATAADVADAAMSHTFTRAPLRALAAAEADRLRAAVTRVAEFYAPQQTEPAVDALAAAALTAQHQALSARAAALVAATAALNASSDDAATAAAVAAATAALETSARVYGTSFADSARTASSVSAVCPAVDSGAEGTGASPCASAVFYPARFAAQRAGTAAAAASHLNGTAAPFTSATDGTTGDVSFLARIVSAAVLEPACLPLCAAHLAAAPFHSPAAASADAGAAAGALAPVLRVGLAPSFSVQNKFAKYLFQDVSRRAPLLWENGLKGENELVAVADTGTDHDHCMFWDTLMPSQTADRLFIGPRATTTLQSKRRKVVQYVTDFGDDSDDARGHGTHVAGSIGGQVDHYDLRQINGLTDHTGSAPAAKLIVYDLKRTRVAELNVPDDFGSEILAHSLAQGANVGSFSWGSSTDYGEFSVMTDKYLGAHPYQLALIAAGNDGVKGFHTVLAPGNCKNVLTVGATENHALRSTVSFTLAAAESGEWPAERRAGDLFMPAAFNPVSRPLAFAREALALVPGGSAGACDAGPALTERYDGRVAVVDRGVCGFLLKVKALTARGAKFVVVVNNVVGDPITMGNEDGELSDGRPYVAAGMVSSAAGAWLRARLAAGRTVTVEGPTTAYSQEGFTHAVAEFSARGPTLDGRVKPDVLAPGQMVTSAASDGNSNSNNCLESNVTGSYQPVYANKGTSMATPLAAGATAQVRQYFREGWYPTGRPVAGDARTPTAALLRAVAVAASVPAAGVVAANNAAPGYPASAAAGYGRHNETVAAYGKAPGPGAGYGRLQFDAVVPLATNTTEAEAKAGGAEVFVSLARRLVVVDTLWEQDSAAKAAEAAGAATTPASAFTGAAATASSEAGRKATAAVRGAIATPTGTSSVPRTALSEGETHVFCLSVRGDDVLALRAAHALTYTPTAATGAGAHGAWDSPPSALLPLDSDPPVVTVALAWTDPSAKAKPAGGSTPVADGDATVSLLAHASVLTNDLDLVVEMPTLAGVVPHTVVSFGNDDGVAVGVPRAGASAPAAAAGVSSGGYVDAAIAPDVDSAVDWVLPRSSLLRPGASAAAAGTSGDFAVRAESAMPAVHKDGANPLERASIPLSAVLHAAVAKPAAGGAAGGVYTDAEVTAVLQGRTIPLIVAVRAARVAVASAGVAGGAAAPLQQHYALVVSGAELLDSAAVVDADGAGPWGTDVCPAAQEPPQQFQQGVAATAQTMAATAAAADSSTPVSSLFCPRACSRRGRCVRGQCQCGWVHSGDWDAALAAAETRDLDGVSPAVPVHFQWPAPELATAVSAGASAAAATAVHFGGSDCSHIATQLVPCAAGDDAGAGGSCPTTFVVPDATLYTRRSGGRHNYTSPAPVLVTPPVNGATVPDDPEGGAVAGDAAVAGLTPTAAPVTGTLAPGLWQHYTFPLRGDMLPRARRLRRLGLPDFLETAGTDTDVKTTGYVGTLASAARWVAAAVLGASSAGSPAGASILQTTPDAEPLPLSSLLGDLNIVLTRTSPLGDPDLYVTLDTDVGVLAVSPPAAVTDADANSVLVVSGERSPLPTRRWFRARNDSCDGCIYGVGTSAMAPPAGTIEAAAGTASVAAGTRYSAMTIARQEILRAGRDLRAHRRVAAAAHRAASSAARSRYSDGSGYDSDADAAAADADTSAASTSGAGGAGVAWAPSAATSLATAGVYNDVGVYAVHIGVHSYCCHDVNYTLAVHHLAPLLRDVDYEAPQPAAEGDSWYTRGAGAAILLASAAFLVLVTYAQYRRSVASQTGGAPAAHVTTAAAADTDGNAGADGGADAGDTSSVTESRETGGSIAAKVAGVLCGPCLYGASFWTRRGARRGAQRLESSDMPAEQSQAKRGRGGTASRARGSVLHHARGHAVTGDDDGHGEEGVELADLSMPPAQPLSVGAAKFTSSSLQAHQDKRRHADLAPVAAADRASVKPKATTAQRPQLTAQADAGKRVPAAARPSPSRAKGESGSRLGPRSASAASATSTASASPTAAPSVTASAPVSAGASRIASTAASAANSGRLSPASSPSPALAPPPAAVLPPPPATRGRHAAVTAAAVSVAVPPSLTADNNFVIAVDDDDDEYDGDDAMHSPRRALSPARPPARTRSPTYAPAPKSTRAAATGPSHAAGAALTPAAVRTAVRAPLATPVRRALQDYELPDVTDIE